MVFVQSIDIKGIFSICDGAHRPLQPLINSGLTLSLVEVEGSKNGRLLNRPVKWNQKLDKLDWTL
jgi:hypothetical protein